MIKKLICLILLLLSLTGCVPAKYPSSAGTHHTMELTVNIDSNNVAMNLQISITVDVKIRTGEHGINRAGGKPYPTSWHGKSPQGSSIDYWSGSNPTTFIVKATLANAVVRSLRITNKSIGLDDPVRISCEMKKDGQVIDTRLFRGTKSRTTTRRKAEADAKDAFVNCIYVDQSTY